MKTFRWAKFSFPKGKEFNHRSGFTLIEVLIAVSILAFGLLAAAQMQGSSIRYNKMGRDLTAAIMLAQSQLEYYKATTDYNQMTAETDRVLPPDPDPKFSGFTIKRTVINGPENPPIWKMIKITVSWSGYFFRSYTITSTVAAPPPQGA